MAFRVLHASSHSDRAHWLQLWHGWPNREVAAHPDYVQLFTDAPEQAIAATWESSGTKVLFPLVLRAIGDLPWARGLDGCDLTGPYGYGGPFMWGDHSIDLEPFWRSFDDWGREARVISAFARLTLFAADLAPMLRGVVAPKQLNIVRTLRLGDEELLRDYEHKVRKNIKRATSSGITIEFDQDCSRMHEFLTIYRSTLDRRSATAGYYFGADFFRRLCRLLTGQFIFAHALLDGRVVSTELVLLSATHAYSFLGGTLSDAFPMRPNDLLKHEVTRWAREHGKTAYVLGGGYGGEDGIYRYKRSFSPNGQREFRVWKHIIDTDAYRHAVEVRRRHAQLTNLPWAPIGDFFPAYRS